MNGPAAVRPPAQLQEVLQMSERRAEPAVLSGKPYIRYQVGHHIPASLHCSPQPAHLQLADRLHLCGGPARPAAGPRHLGPRPAHPAQAHRNTSLLTFTLTALLAVHGTPPSTPSTSTTTTPGRGRSGGRPRPPYLSRHTPPSPPGGRRSRGRSFSRQVSWLYNQY